MWKYEVDTTNTRKKEEKMKNDTFTLGGKEFSSRFILGSGKYSMELIKAAVENAGAQIITLAVRRTNTKKKENILDFIPDNVTLLPNTSGARDAKEAVRIARMARAQFEKIILNNCNQTVNKLMHTG